MDRIPAASNLLIETQPESWRLLLNGSALPTSVPQTLLEARSGEPIRYVELFGMRRKLPMGGELAISDVERIVLGWSAKDEAWHLGIVLNGSLADERGSRWCELAHWIDSERTAYQQIAVSAGEALAAQIDRPFVLIPPVEPQIPVPLPELPLKFESWTFESTQHGQFEFVRAPGWVRSRLLRAVWYLFWMALFLLLSLASVTSGLAFPRPELLVPAGFVCAFVLLVAASTLIVRVFTRPNRIVIGMQGVRWLRGNSEVKSIPVSEVQGVYASLIVGAPKRRAREIARIPQHTQIDSHAERAVHYGELTLDLRSDTFVSLLAHGAVEQPIPLGENSEAGDTLAALTPFNRHTHLQAAAWMIGELLRVPVTFDRRMR